MTIKIHTNIEYKLYIPDLPVNGYEQTFTQWITITERDSTGSLYITKICTLMHVEFSEKMWSVDNHALC